MIFVISMKPDPEIRVQKARAGRIPLLILYSISREAVIMFEEQFAYAMEHYHAEL